MEHGVPEYQTVVFLCDHTNLVNGLLNSPRDKLEPVETHTYEGLSLVYMLCLALWILINNFQPLLAPDFWYFAPTVIFLSHALIVSLQGFAEV